MELFSQQKLSQQAEAQDQSKLMQMAQVAVQAKHFQDQQDDREFVFNQQIASNQKYPMSIRLAAGNKTIKKIDPSFTLSAENLDHGLQLVRDMTEAKAAGKPLEPFADLAKMYLEQGMIGVESLGPVNAALQDVKAQQVQQVAEAAIPEVPGKAAARKRVMDAKNRMAEWDQLQQTPDDPTAQANMQNWQNLYGSPQGIKERLATDMLVVEESNRRDDKRKTLATLYRQDPDAMHKSIGRLTEPGGLLLPYITQALEQKDWGQLDAQDKKSIVAYGMATNKPELIKLAGESTAGTELARWRDDLNEVQGRANELSAVSNVVDGATREANGLHQRLMEQAKVYAKQTLNGPEELKGFNVQMERNQAELADATAKWDEVAKPVKIRMAEDRQKATARIADLRASLLSPGADRETLKKRIDEQQALIESNGRIEQLMGVLSPYDLATAKLSRDHYDIDLKIVKDPAELARIQKLHDHADEQVRDIEAKQADAKARLGAEQLRLIQRTKLANAQVSRMEKKSQQETADSQGVMAFLGDALGKGEHGVWPNPDQFLKQHGNAMGLSPDGFMKQLDPYLKRKESIMEGLAQEDLHARGDIKYLGEVAKKWGVRPDKIMGVLKDPNKPMVMIDMPSKASEEAAKDFTKSTRATYDQLKAAPILLRNIDEAKALIPQAKGFMGPGGEGLLEAAKFLNSRLGAKINTEGVKSAEELRTRVFFNIMENLKKMDAQPSEMQQMMMRDALGKLGTDPNALGNVLDAYGDTIRDKVELFNTEVAGAEKKGTNFPYDPRIILPERRSPTGEPIVRTESERSKLAPGTVYIGPDGKKRTKQ